MFETLKRNAMLAAIKVRGGLMSMDHDDQEGMEVIQVLVLLALGLGLVALFMTFSDQITSAVSEKIQEFLDQF